jgi:pimeloyl-ACP methyl ester carboxylesterase
LRANPDDPAERGPWAVGARTVDIEGLTVEVWYPAPPGSEAGTEPVVYDIRDALPETEQTKISDEDNPPQTCDCYRDLPVDDAYGPYPAIVFIHGTAGFRSQSLPQMVHWASRGFVVIAADHPGLWLADTLGSLCGAGMTPQDLAGDRARLVAGIRGQVSGLEFLGDSIDSERFGMAGHSAGGNAISDGGEDAQVVVPMAAGGVSAGAALQSTLILGGTADSVVQYDQQVSGYESSPAPKRLVGLDGAGHLAFSEICSLSNAAGQDLLEIATENGVCGAQFAGFLFQCDDALLPDADGWEIVDFSTAAAFEETLHCSDIGAAFDEIEQRFDSVSEFRSE